MPATPFEFTDADGKKRTLPPFTDASEKLTGQDLRDALLEGQNVSYLLKAVEAVADGDSVAALYKLPQGQMVKVLDAWSDHADGDGATLGE